MSVVYAMTTSNSWQQRHRDSAPIKTLGRYVSVSAAPFPLSVSPYI